jgi:transposase
LALAEPDEQFRFRLDWSHWRRQHQATAKAGHSARRARRPMVLPVRQPSAFPEPARGSPELTEAQWQRIQPLLPPPRRGPGRRPHDHRIMVAAMLWVERTGCSWRALPSRFGPWGGVYARYQRWRKDGLWARILQVLDELQAHAAAA